ncbi:hypothetical protein JG688_00017483 [Phytophthora aleatoria]|uniref:Uncharacterized protein n=1 Tax=Phytophthora aleatoria TaxID=2496075 RepID=A0A8J5MBQ9_9STRA|nr:hypothetical protein JG688_00017483 [Phytophthora aleatoria]
MGVSVADAGNDGCGVVALDEEGVRELGCTGGVSEDVQQANIPGACHTNKTVHGAKSVIES